MIDLQKASIALNMPIATVTAIVRLVDAIRSVDSDTATVTESKLTRATELLNLLEHEFAQKM